MHCLSPQARAHRPSLAWLLAVFLSLFPNALVLAAEDSAPHAAPPVPTPEQLAWHEAGIGLFFHWAPNVYQGGEGDNLSTPRDRINPDRFDPREWVEAVKAATGGYMIFVAKHVGGYCAWQTETTDYSLRTSPWKGGRGDMLAELATACHDASVRLGVYLSPRDDTHGSASGGTMAKPEEQPAYNELYRRQLTEILTRYGPMFEMWFDGGNVVPLNDLVDRLAPGLIAFQGRRPGGTRWVGTEHGFAPYPCWNTIDWKPGETPKEGAGTPTGNLWCPAECDVSIIRPRWFWSAGSDAAILSLESLLEIYYLSVGRGVNLLLNVTPDDHAVVPPAQMERLREFGAEIRTRFDHPLASTNGAGPRLELDLGATRTIDHLRLREQIADGERVRKFVVEGLRPGGKWTVLARGSQIGARQIIPLPACDITRLRITIENATAPVTLREFAAFHVDRPVPALAYREGGRLALRPPNLSRSRDGHFAIDCPTPDWEIRYTLDGTEPTRQSPVYREPQALPQGGVVRARYYDLEDAARPAGPIATRPFGLPPDRIKVIRVSSEEADTPATAAFDGDPRTMWHTGWKRQMIAPPHELVVDLGRSCKVTGIGYLSRQDAVGNFPTAIRVWVSDRPDAFAGQPLFTGDFGDFTTDPQSWRTTRFPQPLAGRFLRLVYPDEVRHSQCVASAEIEIMVAPESATPTAR